MMLLRLQFFTLSLLLFLSGGLYTMSYFSDIEGAEASTFMATVLDQDVAGQPIDGLLCSQTDRVNTVLYSANVGATDFEYGFAVQNATGTLCAGLEARLINDADGMLYDGPLLALQTEGIVLPAGSADELHLELRLAADATQTGTCSFDTAWLAEQLAVQLAPGYNDAEVLSHFVTGSATGIGGGCVPPGDTVNLHLSKAISGVDLGYELSDFSYRVTGNGINALVPHDHTIALQEGVYTIEEIVPEDFVKADWRIGWYGACDRGSSFSTTITIDEGNVDHGTLYCQADNQYRPENNPAHVENSSEEDEVIEEPEEDEEESSGRSGRGERTERRLTTEPAPAVAGDSMTDLEVEQSSEDTEEVVSESVELTETEESIAVEVTEEGSGADIAEEEIEEVVTEAENEPEIEEEEVPAPEPEVSIEEEPAEPEPVAPASEPAA